MFALLLALSSSSSSLCKKDPFFGVLEREAPSTSSSVVYIDACRSGEVVKTVAAGLESSEERARALTEIGAVWYRADERWQRYWPSTSRLPESFALRVYPRPKRYREGCAVDWSARVLHVDAAYLIVDKPAMLPTQADNGNAVECVAACAARGLDDVGILRPAHRLDAVVSGCCCLARNQKALRAFQDWLDKGKVTKVYEAVVRGGCPLPPGGTVVEHDMLVPSTYADRRRFDDLFGPGPRLLRRDADDRGFDRKAWKRCSLVVEDAVVLPVAAAAAAEEQEDNPNPEVALSIRLVTGRPHQIRAQLSAIGLPIVGDDLYATSPGTIKASLLGVGEEEENFSQRRAQRATLKPPSHPIKLTARALRFAGRDVSVKTAATAAPDDRRREER